MWNMESEDTSGDKKELVLVPGKPRIIKGRTHVSRFKVPDHIALNEELNYTISQLLPSNYNFEVHKTLYRIEIVKAKRIALQLPEGLQRFGCSLADIFETYSVMKPHVCILGDVTYGACCIDDLAARALDCQLLVHYGHSCLIPVDKLGDKDLSFLYVFVDIQFDKEHFVESLKAYFKRGTCLAIVSTIQFVATLQSIRKDLEDYFEVVIPHAKPLSPGEILGCTAPQIIDPRVQEIIYLGDGRFHLEAMMMANPKFPVFTQYNPYDKAFTKEGYDYKKMTDIRRDAIEKAKSGKTFGVILGTLGRQGAPYLVDQLRQRLTQLGKRHITVLLSEVMPDKLRLFQDVDVWIQVACPRLSIDWGVQYPKPLLTPYEANVMLGSIEWQEQYPTDFYAYDSLGPWTVNNAAHRPARRPRKTAPVQEKATVCADHGTTQCTNCSCVT